MKKKHHIALDDTTRDILTRSTITDNKGLFGYTLTLPEQLPRPDYERANKVLLAAGGKWNKKAKAHVFANDPREVLGLAIETGAIIDKKKATQAFYTPDVVALSLAEYADVKDRTVLEPSAGHGMLAKACYIAGAARVVCVELDPDSAKVLRDKKYAVHEGDFLEWNPAISFERVVMNPPFTGAQDIAHVTRAFDFLSTGGILVAIVAPGFRFNQSAKHRQFRDLMAEAGEIVEELPGGTFKESGTDVQTVVIRLHK